MHKWPYKSLNFFKSVPLTNTCPPSRNIFHNKTKLKEHKTRTSTTKMGGGNAQKTAMARQKHAEKEASQRNAGGGKKGMEARSGGDMSAAMAAAQAKREEVKKKREEKGKN
mmetsp:Transcript_1619/g.2248  ORF Transcript_1619/g.2248 Transcript_1619/m.2248 type:complete len:111 (+) Transcript_1619:1189-1521(+)